MTEQPAVRAPFGGLPDVASRVLGGSVQFASDEFFADANHLIEPGRPAMTRRRSASGASCTTAGRPGGAGNRARTSPSSGWPRPPCCAG